MTSFKALACLSLFLLIFRSGWVGGWFRLKIVDKAGFWMGEEEEEQDEEEEEWSTFLCPFIACLPDPTQGVSENKKKNMMPERGLFMAALIGVDVRSAEDQRKLCTWPLKRSGVIWQKNRRQEKKTSCISMQRAFLTACTFFFASYAWLLNFWVFFCKIVT